MIKILIAVYIIINIISCASYNYLIEDVKNGMHLENAKEENVQKFFQKRMTNRAMYKSGAIQRRWNIIIEDSNYVYYGFTQHKNFSDVNTPMGALDEFFKVDKQKLFKLFPDYKNVQGYHIFDITWNSMDHGKDSQLFRDNCTSGSNEWQFYLKQDNYLIEHKYFCEEEIFKKSKKNKIYEYTFVISKKDLSVLELKRTVFIK